MTFKSEQEQFWAGNFGDEYIDRNSGHSKLYYFSKMLLANGVHIDSAIELGANIGINLDALSLLYPGIGTFGVEINSKAHSLLSEKHEAFLGSVYKFNSSKTYGLSFCAGVLIHQSPNLLPAFYEKLYDLSNKYILINEYHSPRPVELLYRGHAGKLFTRDFGKEFWNQYPDLDLVDYGFIWSMDPLSLGEDSNWFLFKKP